MTCGAREQIIKALKEHREIEAEKFSSVTVLFCEVCDFGMDSHAVAPELLVNALNIIFSEFDSHVDELEVRCVGDRVAARRCDWATGTQGRDRW